MGSLPSVIVVDSKGNEQSMGQIYAALKALETEGKIQIDVYPATDSLVNDIIGQKKPDLIIVHVHAFGANDKDTIAFIREASVGREMPRADRRDQHFEFLVKTRSIVVELGVCLESVIIPRVNR